MKFVVGGIVGLLLAATAANAADMPQGPYGAPVAPAPPAAPFTGFYLGLNGGYGAGSANATALGLTVSERLSGPFAGGQIGFNMQTGMLVYGLEVDGQWSDIKKSVTVLGVTATDRIAAFATARGRFGAAFGNIMFYGTGGAGYGNFASTATIGGFSLSTSTSRALWTVGGGLESVWGPWMLRSEFLYIQSTDKTIGGATGNVSASLARAAVSYRFWN